MVSIHSKVSENEDCIIMLLGIVHVAPWRLADNKCCPHEGSVPHLRANYHVCSARSNAQVDATQFLPDAPTPPQLGR